MTPTDPIEAVARAIYCASFNVEGETFASMPVEHRAHWIAKARAALTAMRDCGVTEGMEEAASDFYIHVDGETIFRAMLDAALKGE